MAARESSRQYRDVCGLCAHIERDLCRELELARLSIWDGRRLYKCDLDGVPVEPLDSPSNCCSSACGCTSFERRAGRARRGLAR